MAGKAVQFKTSVDTEQGLNWVLPPGEASALELSGADSSVPTSWRLKSFGPAPLSVWFDSGQTYSLELGAGQELEAYCKVIHFKLAGSPPPSGAFATGQLVGKTSKRQEG